jgi:hypothetical protein
MNNGRRTRGEQSINRVLALWRVGLLTDAEVVIWADRTIMSSDEVGEAVAELSLKGPRRYWELPRADFPHPDPLSFLEEFSLRVVAINISSILEQRSFVEWLSRACMGQDLGVPEVKFGYHVEHLWGDCDDMQAATALVRQRLPEFLPSCQERATPYWSAYTGA